MSSAPLSLALPPVDSSVSSAPLSAALSPVDSPVSSAPLSAALPPVDSSVSSAPLSLALPPVDSSVSSAPLGVALPPVESSAWGSQSWLDHCISTEDGNDIITNAHVVYEFIKSVHIPVVFELDLQLAPDVQPGACHSNADRIDWSLLSDEVIYNYGAKTELLLSNIVLPTDALLCKDCNCRNDSHTLLPCPAKSRPTSGDFHDHLPRGVPISR